MKEVKKMENTAKKIIEATLKNGGYSHDTKHRYSVAYGDNEFIISLKEFNEEVVHNYLKVHGTIGTWINTENNMVYLDTSKTIENKGEAIEFAKETNQLAIYDLIENEEIAIN